MALTEIVVKETGHNGLKFPEHDLAHRLLGDLHGLELGPSSHNSFNLQGSQSVAPADDFEFYKNGQVTQNGKYIQPDIVGEADSIPVAADSQDYVLSSHVFEHIPDIFRALVEWVRVLRDRGYVFMIVPQRDALDSDRGRALTTYEELETAFNEGYTPDTMPEERTKAAGGSRGHYWVFTSESLKNIIERFTDVLAIDHQASLQLVEEEDPDKKVGNGFCLVYRVIKMRKPEPIPEDEQKLVDDLVSHGLLDVPVEENLTTSNEPEVARPKKATRKKKV
jgi:SAM-dependent methyltransferase